MSQEPDLHEIQKRLEHVEHKLGIFYPAIHEAELLEGILTSLDGRTVQQIFREVDAKDLALAMVGFGAKALQVVKDNVSKKAWEMLKDDIAYYAVWCGAGNSQTIARLKIIYVINQLEEMGEIVVRMDNIPALEKRPPFDYKAWQKRLEDEHNERVKQYENWKKEVFDLMDK